MNIDRAIEQGRKHLPSSLLLEADELREILEKTNSETQLIFIAYLIGYERCRRYEQRQRRLENEKC